MLSAGTTLGGRYRLDERIAGGGMGDVWRGTDEVLGRTVAIKVLLPALLEEPGFAERFRGEARTMATINHPGVVDIYDYGSENGTAFLIMEYVEGDALSRTLARVGRLTPARAMALIAQAADALHAAHEKGIVHRDVKPGNLLVRPNGTLVLTDFGIARSAAVAQLTAAGSVLGTASYISPEQASGAQATPLSDVYALGVVAYQCLSGQRPFEGENPLEIAMRHVREMPPPLPSDVPASAVQLVERAIAKDPTARWPSAAALAQAARRVSAQLGGGTATGPAVPLVGPPVSGAPVSPVSGGPSYGQPTSGSPMSGPPVSGSPVSPGAGGTRVMPGAAIPPLAGAGMAAAGGHAARGAAGVPPPPPSGDTATFLGGTGGYRPPPPPPGSGSRSGGNRNNLVIVGIAAIVLLVLIGVGGIYLATRNGDSNNQVANEGPSTAPTSASPTPSAKATGRLVPVNCKVVGQQKAFVENDLKRKGFDVKTVVDETAERPLPNTITKIEPCGEVAQGSEITLTVSKGVGGPGNKNSSAPAPGNSPSGGSDDRSPEPNGSATSCPPGKVLVNGACVGA
ncbi:serine/threonine protein kinase [Dactylosporangium roseum]|uniref:non-specific serine/threonine protein kinase n=1 Tax=Dactylosporangium roseum TaxID=47989 RepID=A0ABY5Z467_9ACTN|nr:serine/threonine-protein kinase [Dactylosporangium roseum]UWZ36831.1 serine/threonine protein kinase [Dactylosporangium roseum]